jgi:opacity protein-like surface antigen
MKMTSITRFVFLILFSFPLLCLAQDYEPIQYNADVTFYAGGFLGDDFVLQDSPLFIPDNFGVTMGDDFIGGFRLAYNLNRYFAVEGSMGFTPASIASVAQVNGGFTGFSTIRVDTYVFSADMLTNLVPEGPVRPFVTGGVSAVHFTFRDSPAFFTLNPSETDFAFNAGGGVRVRFRHDMSFRFDGRYYWLNPEFSTEDNLHFVELSGGVSVDFNF